MSVGVKLIDPLTRIEFDKSVVVVICSVFGSSVCNFIVLDALPPTHDIVAAWFVTRVVGEVIASVGADGVLGLSVVSG